MEERSKVHIGMDVHNDSISVGLAAPGREPGHSVGQLRTTWPGRRRFCPSWMHPIDLHLVNDLHFVKGKPAFTTCWFNVQLTSGKFTSLNKNQPACLTASQATALVKALHLG